MYTAQGFEYDRSGVIVGPDLVRRGGRWIARREHSHDSAAKKADDLEFGRLVRNTYKVLLIRGMRGTCVYSTDPETQAFLEEMAG
ncbi:DNA/RNA helicase domain-containing protein [Amycolatopsis methanolica]|uniref:DNA/RNA helicase domain-containing protein n=1 Tax=Amycolatopsis methanolica TaxID=1814 RepID=UPI002B3FFE66|nr:DNA/RNA helicase domain-containing protein [Amycolatopsis methanolica]